MEAQGALLRLSARRERARLILPVEVDRTNDDVSVAGRHPLTPDFG